MNRRDRMIYQFGSVIITTTDTQWAYLGFRDGSIPPLQISRWTAARCLIELRKLERGR